MGLRCKRIDARILTCDCCEATLIVSALGPLPESVARFGWHVESVPGQNGFPTFHVYCHDCLTAPWAPSGTVDATQPRPDVLAGT